MAKRPNFLFFITDQQRADFLGCAGHPVLRTPHIDSIAARGRQFERFYVANPICMPNRSTLMTGRMPSLHGVRSNGIALSFRANTFVDLMRGHGYKTALLGKSHLQNMTGNPAILKAPEAPEDYLPPPPAFAEALKPSAENGPVDAEAPRGWREDPDWDLPYPFYGFEHVDLCTEHGDLVGGHYWQWLKDRHGDPDTLRGPDNALAHDYACPQAWRTAIPIELYPTRYVQDKTVEFLEGYAAAPGDAPFFAMASFPDPHHPFTPPGKYWGMHRPQDMTLDASFSGTNRAPPPHVQFARDQRDAGTAVTTIQTLFAIGEREAREARALTCDMIAMIDDAVGQILGTLDRLGLREDTVVVFTADHGDYLGDHQLLLKGPIHYQSLIRVPFLWADTPDRCAPIGASSTVSGTLDIAATILDRAKIAPYNGIQGKSLMPLIDGGAEDPEAEILIEEDQQRITLGFSDPPRTRTLVNDRWRMTLYHGVGWGELYDLRNDPSELNNLWDDAGTAGHKAELMERLARRQIALVDRSPLPTNTA